MIFNFSMPMVSAIGQEGHQMIPSFIGIGREEQAQ